jgi:predicted lysophospholipase L1 biosynthesis ABC-type transport system permease subunit
VSVPPYLADPDEGTAARNTKVWPTAAISPERLRRLPAQRILVATNGSRSVIEHARVALDTAFQHQQSPITVSEFRANTSGAKELAGYQQLVNVVILASLCIAGCGLAVSVVAGLNDRKRPFSLLRLSGVQLGILRRIVTLETAVPLLITAVVATGAGALAAQLFLKSQMDYNLRSPAAAYYIVVVAGLAASLGVIASTLPLLKHITGPQTARNE